MPTEPRWGQLNAQQQERVHMWLPGAVLEENLSWGLVDTTVLRARHHEHLCVIKAGGVGNHHIRREIDAHLQWLQPLTTAGRAPLLLHADPDAQVLVTRWVPGHLAQDTPAAIDPDVHHQAGALLAQLHHQHSACDATFKTSANARTLTWLDADHTIPPSTEEALRAEVLTWPTPPAVVVPTHGDYHPRNWLVQQGRVVVIDFGRTALRPAASDLVRLVQRDWRGHPELEAAFLQGYGSDPRAEDGWRRLRVREAVGTAVWAHQVGDEAFEQEGLRLLAELTTMS